MHKIKIKLKRLGKKKIHSLEYEIDAVIDSLRALITAIVTSEVHSFNEKIENPAMISFLTPDQLEEEAQEGKVSFGERYATNKVIQSEAIENALLSFADGMFAVFINDEEIRALDQAITVNDESEIVFLRMTFLTGRY